MVAGEVARAGWVGGPGEVREACLGGRPGGGPGGNIRGGAPGGPPRSGGGAHHHGWQTGVVDLCGNNNGNAKSIVPMVIF